MPRNLLNLALLKVAPGTLLDPVLAIGSTLPLPPIGPVPGPLTVTETPGAITFAIAGVGRWQVDVKLFAGQPQLTVQHSPVRTRIELTHARFPGTDLFADFVAVVEPRTFRGTPMTLTFALGGFSARVILERWLAGLQQAQSPVHLATDVCPLGATSKLAVSGDADARFFPTWLFQMGGQNLATVSDLSPDLVSDRFFLKLLTPSDPTLSAQPKSRRTLLSLAASGHTWLLKPRVLTLPIGTLAAAEGLFDRLEIEAGESAAGDIARVLAASSSRDDALSFTPGGGLTDLDAHPLTVPLANAVYAIGFDPTADRSQGDQASLSAEFRRSGKWLTLEGFAMLIAGSAATPHFEVESVDDTTTAVRCTPALLAVAAPLAAPAGQIVSTQPLPVAAGSVLPLVAAPGTSPGWGVLAAPPAPGQPRLSIPDLHVGVVRRDDLLSLEFEFFNFAIEAGGGVSPRLVRKVAADAAFIAAVFNTPQNLAEQAFLETYTDPAKPSNNITQEVPSMPPVRVLAAGPSRLAFRVPDDLDQLPFALDALLDWTPLAQSVVPVAQPDPPPPLLKVPKIRAPLPTETAIEAPWRVMLSPLPSATWTHANAPVTREDRTELWHTRLAVRTPKDDGFVADESQPRKVRAVWTPDYSLDDLPHAEPPVPFRMSLDKNDRNQIVRLSSDFTIPSYNPPAIVADKLFLTSLGAWLDLLGDFNVTSIPNTPFSLEQWRHKAAMARDNYVRVVYAGYLCPGGHRASLVKITERKFQPNPSGHTTAYLRQRFFIIVREPHKNYRAPGFLTEAEQRGFPYQGLRITTLVTPNLDAPQVDANGKYSFFPKVAGSDFLFHFVGQDADGGPSELSTPLYFVELSGQTSSYSNAVTKWNGSAVKTRSLSGQSIAFAPSDKPGDTALQTSTITVDAATRGGDPPFFPQMASANVRVPAIQQITGLTTGIDVHYYAKYVSTGFEAGGVFLEKAGGPLAVGFSGDKSGGVATPNLQVSGLSRRFGVVSGNVGNIAGGNFNPSDFFGDLNAKLFGVIPLKTIIVGLFGDNTVPALVTEHLPTAVQTKLHWAPRVQNVTVGPVALVFDNAATALKVDALVVTPLGGGAPQASVNGSLSGFALTLAGVVGIKFVSLTFDAPAGKKLDVAANIEGDGLQFLGDLSFLNDLRKLIPSDGFSDPPSVEVTPSGVTCGYSLAIPTVGIGVFSIENISLNAALTLPFLPPNGLRFRFSFSERERPFLITVSLLGGGGFFGIALGPDGVEMVEASFEIGANVSIDVVVASGNVHIMAGVYLKISETTKESQLTGYLRAGGSVDVLGIISASIEFYLGFTYYFGPPCRIAGEATITIEVHVLFFSASVKASLRREFADPTIAFADLIAPADWDYYCDSFAA
jgi:hypothetical protein